MPQLKRKPVRNTQVTIDSDSQGSGTFSIVAPVAFGMANGAFLFSVMALWLNRGSGDWAPTSLDFIWVGAALLCLGLHRFWWNTKVTPHLPADRLGAGPSSDPQALYAALVQAWAPLEAASLFGLVIYFVQESYWGLTGGLAFILFAILFVRPQRKWFASPG
jgi:hypothetical protein